MIFVGKILKTRGNKGEVVVGLDSGQEDIFFIKDQAVFLKSKKYSKGHIIEYCRQQGNHVIVKLQDINSIEQAYRLVGYMIHIEEESVPETDQKPLNFVVQDIQQKKWGTVRAIRHFGMNKLLEVSDNDEVIYVPWNNEIIKEIRDREGLIIIDPPDGLLDLNK